MKQVRTLEADLKKERSLREHLEWKLRDLQAKLFGKSSEKIDPNQLQLIRKDLRDYRGGTPSHPLGRIDQD